MPDYNDGAEGAGAEGYDDDYGTDQESEGSEDEAWDDDDVQRAWDEHLDEGDPQTGTEDWGPPPSEPWYKPISSNDRRPDTVRASTPEEVARDVEDHEREERLKDCETKPYEYRELCEAANRGEPRPYGLGDEPAHIPHTGPMGLPRNPVTGIR